MTPERWQQVKAIFQSAIEREPQERALFLAQACVDDPRLRDEVEALISSYEQAGGEQAGCSLETVAVDVAAQILAGQQAAPAVGQQVGHYELIKQIGAGGMGEVYLAQDSKLARKVALKLLPSHVIHDRQRLERFKQEARAASALNHPNILTIYEIGEEAGRPFIATEFIEGETLRDCIAHTRLAIGEALDVAAQVAAGLNAAHEAGIVHRDIKPENIMLRHDGYVKILDFGLAKLIEPQAAGLEVSVLVKTDEGVVMGTPRYMSPEQARGQKMDGRTDIFSLGAVLYEMLSGRAPFEGATPGDVIVSILEREPPPVSRYAEGIPVELDWVVKKALRKERERRYQTIKDVLTDLRNLNQELEYKARQARAPVAEAEEAAATLAEPALRTAPAEAARPTSSAEYLIGEIKRHKRGVAVGLSALALAVVSLAYLLYFARTSQAIDSIAVLPLANNTSDSNNDYLSDGITESLINNLSQLPRLRVMARTTAFRYKGKEVDPRAVGRELGVRAVLTGSLRQRGDQLTIQIDLVETAEGAQLWGEQYNRQPSDLFTVQAELSRDISEKLRLRLSSEDKQRLTKRHTENPEAFELYLKGRYYMNSLSAEGRKKGLEYFQRAIEKDPHFGKAYAGLAEYYAGAVFSSATSDIPPKEASLKAKEAAIKAVELDDTLAEAHAALAKIATLQEWDWKGAEREFRRAIALNPNYVDAHHYYSHYLISLGRFDESLAESQLALALDPLDAHMNFHLGFHYYQARQYDQAIAQLQKTLDIKRDYSEAHAILGLVYEQQGRYQEAIAEMQKNMEMSGSDQRGSIGHVYATSGQRGEAQKLLNELREESKRKYVSPYNIAKIYEGLDEKDQAFTLLEKAYAERDSNIINLKVDPRFDSLRSDPRFRDLLRRIGLPQ